MIITRAKINGVVNPLGYSFEKLIATWNVEETESTVLKNGVLEVAADTEFTDILYKNLISLYYLCNNFTQFNEK